MTSHWQAPTRCCLPPTLADCRLIIFMSEQEDPPARGFASKLRLCLCCNLEKLQSESFFLMASHLRECEQTNQCPRRKKKGGGAAARVRPDAAVGRSDQLFLVRRRCKELMALVAFSQVHAAVRLRPPSMLAPNRREFSLTFPNIFCGAFFPSDERVK